MPMMAFLGLTLCCMRRGSKKRIPGVIYNIDQPALVPSLGWRGRVEGAGTAARLGLALRTLDVQISWEGLKRPSPDSGGPFASLEIVFKRPASSGQGSEYQLHQPEEVRGSRFQLVWHFGKFLLSDGCKNLPAQLMRDSCLGCSDSWSSA